MGTCKQPKGGKVIDLECWSLHAGQLSGAELLCVKPPITCHTPQDGCSASGFTAASCLRKAGASSSTPNLWLRRWRCLLLAINSSPQNQKAPIVSDGGFEDEISGGR
jgi:hypothetical protein